MKFLQGKGGWVVKACLAGWAIFLVLMASFPLIGGNTVSFVIATTLGLLLMPLSLAAA